MSEERTACQECKLSPIPEGLHKLQHLVFIKRRQRVAFPTSRLSGVRQDFPIENQKRGADMSFRDFLNLVVVAALIALSAALHTPYSGSLAAGLTGLTILSH
jgi:hypothetical protein